MKKLTISAMGLAMTAIASCSAGTPPTGYNVKVSLPGADGATAYIVDYDNGEKLDSCIVKDGVATFSGSLAKPVLARMVVGGNRAGTFILEEGTIELGEKQAAGTPLNARMDSLSRQLEVLEQQYHDLPADPANDAQRQAIMDQYDSLLDKMMEANMDNPIGYYLFLQKAYELSLPELEAALEQHPSLASYQRVGKVVDGARKKSATSVGQKMVDFTVESPDGVHRLSDYVGNGKYVLVDFWASWCGPCRKETKTIKKILSEMDPEKFLVLGVAVWDDPDETVRAVKDLDLPWPQIIDAQSIPTDLYGIVAIPSILLFGPDGTILVRDLQGADLEAAVKAAVNSSNDDDKED